MKKITLIFTALMVFATFAGCSKGDDAIESDFSQKSYVYFEEVLKIPHGSGNEKEISDYLVAFAKERNLEVVQDDALNVFIKKPGSAGRENEEPVILQAHMDMVCEKNEGVNHDFLKDPIIPVIDGDWVSADGTTLGADDASGLGMVLAVLDTDTLSHPPLEVIITTEEETGMGGAVAFDGSLLSGKRFINLDSEEEGVFTVSCAGSSDVDLIIPVEYESKPADFTTYKLMVKGLSGGHSGLDINKGLANANILLANVLDTLSEQSICVSSISGGSKRNAIPRESTAIISFPSGDLDSVKSIVASAEKDFKSEYLSDADLTITLEETDSFKDIFTNASKQTVIEAILGTPNGVQSMSASIEGLVQTSNNLGVMSTDGNTVMLSNYARSSDVAELSDIIEELGSLATSVNAQSNVANPTPPWNFKESSPLRDSLTVIYKEMYGEEPAITALHAGLECAVFTDKIPDGDFISIGADITGAHSPDEKMSLSSYERTCDFLVKILEQL